MKKIILISLGAIVLFESLGRLAIYFLEKRQVTGIEAENIMSHNEPLLGFGLKKKHE